MMEPQVPHTVHRYTVPVDDHWHRLELPGPVLHVATRDPQVVELWCEVRVAPAAPVRLRVFGTGHPIPDEAVYVGTALSPFGGLVWHLYRDAG